MCIIIAKASGANLPPRQILETCAMRNPHGCGFATADKVFHTLNFELFYKRLQKETADGKAAIIHFRYATHGSIKTANCHPFRDKDSGVSFAHNGILSIVPYKDMTDSETAFRGLYVPKIQRFGLDSDQLRYEVFSTIGSSRFAFISPEGEIRLFGCFYEFDGCHYSNMNFR